MGKRKQSKSVQVVLLAGGILFACASLYLLISGIWNYAKQFDQKDWKITTATVINVNRRSSGFRHRSYDIYDIYYQYEADGDIYADAVYGSNVRKAIGDTFDVKYDPEAPQDSTLYLEPTLGIVVSSFFGFVIFGAIGLRMIQSSFPKRKKAGFRSRKKTARVAMDENGD